MLHHVQLLLDGHGRKGLAHPVERSPVRGRAPAVQQPRVAEQHRARADRRERLDRAAALGDPVQQALIFGLRAGAPAAGHHQDVERGARVERDVGNDLQPTRRDHGVRCLRDQQDLEWRRLFAPRVLVEPRHREHLERSAEVEHFHVREDQDTHPLAIHGIPPLRQRSRWALLGSLPIGMWCPVRARAGTGPPSRSATGDPGVAGSRRGCRGTRGRTRSR